MAMSDWVGEPIVDMQGAAAILLDQEGVDYINIHMVERDEKAGYSRDLRIIVERKGNEDEDFAHGHHPSRSSAGATG